MLSYIGGKSRIGKWIVEYYPKDMEVYVETFGGMFWCFYNMDLDLYPNLKKVVYNDLRRLTTYLVNKEGFFQHHLTIESYLMKYKRRYL